MKFLGIRCSNKDFSFVILSGHKENPNIEYKDQINYPKGYTRAESVQWFLRELEDIRKKAESISAIGIKGTEMAAKRDKKYEIRVEHEAMILLLAANNDIKQVEKRLNSTIAKGLGVKGKSKYLITKVNYDCFPDYEKLNKKLQEALQVAWSMM